jgi:hypothetical protein
VFLRGDVAKHDLWKQVWDFLTDFNRIGSCMLGVENFETIEKHNPSHAYSPAPGAGIAREWGRI